MGLSASFEGHQSIFSAASPFETIGSSNSNTPDTLMMLSVLPAKEIN